MGNQSSFVHDPNNDRPFRGGRGGRSNISSMAVNSSLLAAQAQQSQMSNLSTATVLAFGGGAVETIIEHVVTPEVSGVGVENGLGTNPGTSYQPGEVPLDKLC